ncbi:hypothetical protein YPPY72_3752, partial [Yersinia pestis PY-72]|jgi:hypothetical protein
MIS